MLAPYHERGPLLGPTALALRPDLESLTSFTMQRPPFCSFNLVQDYCAIQESYSYFKFNPRNWLNDCALSLRLTHTAKPLDWGGGSLPTFKGGLLETSILHYDVYFTEAYGYNNIKHQFGFIQVRDSNQQRYT